MFFKVHDPQALDHWYWLSMQVHCALDPDESCLLDQYLGETRCLAGWEGVAAWLLFERTYNLLLDTGRDPILPWHWRGLCLDYVYRPFCELQRLTTNGSQRRRLHQLSVRMARQDLTSSMSFDHPQQGNQDDWRPHRTQQHE